ncbi:M64 family metallopeptidase [Riemerella columbina]|uniref:M64 family metallopeptidase n=1 Tax=Riemerella columbina TaxID=103810 RepID=UPI00266FD02D|nr:M64 family metallopeptidase [Riemerella columbina]WKS94360.1 IgA Peptidase M64 [Riemerella columbina]
MMIKRFLFTLSFCCIALSYAQNIKYDDFFDEGSLRIDLILSGNYENEQVTLYQLKHEPYYGGGTVHQLFFPDYGNYRILAKDETTGQLIFSKGFSPIFKEWQSTEEAKHRYRTFENTIQMPYPKHNIIVEVQARNRDGKFVNLFSEKISPQDMRIINEKPTPYKSLRYGNQHPKNAVDIAIISEGYTEAEIEKFNQDAKKFIDYMMKIPPFNAHRQDFNIYTIQAPSVESGTDIPGENIYKNTVLNSTFYTFGTPRYLTTLSLFKIADIAANVPYDQIFVIVNTDRYGGGGFYNVMNLVSADDSTSDKVFVHEFGHGFVGLGDEYYNNSGGTEDFYNLKVEPWEPNLTTLVNFKSKWAKHIDKNTPIPTPRIPMYKDKVGVFEGGGYTPKGIYSPALDCRMASNVPHGFCPVCTEAIEKTIEFYKR